MLRRYCRTFRIYIYIRVAITLLKMKNINMCIDFIITVRRRPL